MVANESTPHLIHIHHYSHHTLLFLNTSPSPFTLTHGLPILSHSHRHHPPLTVDEPTPVPRDPNGGRAHLRSVTVSLPSRFSAQSLSSLPLLSSSLDRHHHPRQR
ncbi:hypothetical protein Sjap_019288 [Stephania japonica]|uniref:Uncharacterized protein n=1 Tax=Stephania japonica TaxID=461633 RepID=A0AAP0EZ60_9MAGN